ncbi:MAG TPA: hypothetical protein VND45_11735, partial [Thermoanaerobaculia bacterium]|nr:hypothetical protein [Thermoanaerobaculia bacterium]
IKEADAAAVAKLGTAQASVLREKALAEAQGIQEKAHAMAQLDEATRAHEEFRLRIENERLLGTESIKARLDVEKAKATILGEALRHAKIDIVGGDGQFLDRVVNSIGLGKSIDSMVAQSETAQAVLEKFGVKMPEATPVLPVSPKAPIVRAD